jgi:hypothetical protein
MPAGYWKDITNQRKFMDELAVKLGVSQPDDWYKIRFSVIAKSAPSIIGPYYRGSVIQGT